MHNALILLLIERQQNQSCISHDSQPSVISDYIQPWPHNSLFCMNGRNTDREKFAMQHTCVLDWDKAVCWTLLTEPSGKWLEIDGVLIHWTPELPALLCHISYLVNITFSPAKTHSVVEQALSSMCITYSSLFYTLVWFMASLLIPLCFVECDDE